MFNNHARTYSHEVMCQCWEVFKSSRNANFIRVYLLIIITRVVITLSANITEETLENKFANNSHSHDKMQINNSTEKSLSKLHFFLFIKKHESSEELLGLKQNTKREFLFMWVYTVHSYFHWKIGLKLCFFQIFFEH